MTTPTMNPIATIKEIGAIEHRIHDAALHPNIKAACIRRSLDNLIDTTAPARKFHGIIAKCRAALDAGDDLELISGIALIRSMIPTVYGIIPAGTIYTLPGEDTLWRKSKSGKVSMQSGVLYPHPEASTVVKPVNW